MYTAVNLFSQVVSAKVLGQDPILMTALDSAAPQFHGGGIMEGGMLRISLFVFLAVMTAFCVSVGTLSSALLLSVARPQFVISCGSRMRRTRLLNFVSGIFSVILLLVLLRISKSLPPAWRGIVSPSLLVAICAYLVAGFSVAAYSIGEKIQANAGSAYIGSLFVSILLGGLVLLFMNFLPLIGSLTALGFVVIGCGAILNSLGNSKCESGKICGHKP